MSKKPKPMDLNKHPAADVIRRVVEQIDDARASIGDDPHFAIDAIQDEATMRSRDVDGVLVECAALGLAGLMAMDAQADGAGE